MDAEHYKKRAKHRLVVITIVSCIAAVGIWYFATYSSLSEVTLLGNSIEQFAATEATKTFLAPPPLTATSSQRRTGIQSNAAQAQLTIPGVVAQTNIQRANNGGLSALAESELLNDVATLRLADMFTNQYFAHVSPSGRSALTVASDVGYSYLALGENLALGNFAGDSGVVAAWMNSPGHRENILNTHYTEIGVAVGKGTYEGATTWIAVQVFGRPSSACPAVNVSLKIAIDSGQAKLNQMAADLANDDAQINAMQPKYGQDYNNKVGEYNALVQQYNTLAAQVKQDVAQYNQEVQTFNTCLGQ